MPETEADSQSADEEGLDPEVASRIARALPLRCASIPGESFASLAMRLAARNGLPDLSTVWESGILRHESGLHQSAASVVCLALLAGLPLGTVAALSPLWGERRGKFRTGDLSKRYAYMMGESLESRDFTHQRRVCPVCIAESPHERLVWRVDALAGCLKHNTLFVYECTCGKKLDWVGQVHVCPYCLMELRRLPAEPIQPASEALTAYVEGRLLGRVQVPIRRLDNLRLGQALALVRWVDRVIELSSPEYLALERYASGFAALRGPPDRLFAFIRAVGGDLTHVGRQAALASARVGPGLLQPSFPGLVPEIAEPIAALVREAAAS